MPDSLTIREDAFGTAWMLQSSRDHAERVLGFGLPAAHRWVACQGWEIYWIGPTAWQLSRADAFADHERMRDALIAEGGALFDVSDARVAVEIEGARADELLASGCGIELGAAFPAGECRSTLLARVAVLIAKRDETPSYTVFVPRSYASYLQSWLKLGRT